MSEVVLVHGIAQQYKGPQTLLADWYPALCDGLSLTGASLTADRVSVAFYGDVFRPPGYRGVGDIELDASDVDDELERDLLLAWWEAAAEHESQVVGPDTVTRLRTPRSVQRALLALSHSAFFAGLSEHLMIAAARQVRRYFTEQDLRARIQDRLTASVTERTKVIVAHSLGSVVAYETLCANPRWPEMTLVTLGSPLGIPQLIFDRLIPEPAAGRAQWPPTIKAWTNIADTGDIVALVKSLAARFGEQVQDVIVNNGPRAHDVRPYLTARETGDAVAHGLT